MDKKKVYVIMPFEAEYFEIYKMLEQQFEKDFSFSRAAAEANQPNILKNDIQSIYDSDIVIANLTGLNPNVFYELGVAHTLNKEVIIITEDISTLPFDLKSDRAIEYSTHFVKFTELIDELKKHLKRVIENTLEFSNPVIEALVIKKAEEVKALFHKEATIVQKVDNGINYYYLCRRVYRNLLQIGELFQSIFDGDKMMMSSFEASIDEMKRLRTDEEASSQSVYLETMKLSESMEAYNFKLSTNCDTLLNTWSIIEEDTLYLIKNTFDSKQKDILKMSLSVMNSLQATLIAMKLGTEMKASEMKILGDKLGESLFKQSVFSCINKLNAFIRVITQIIASIDKIFSKNRIVVGEEF